MCDVTMKINKSHIHSLTSEGFAICFLKVPLDCLGSMAAAVQPNGLGKSLKTFYKTYGTSFRPRL